MDRSGFAVSDTSRSSEQSGKRPDRGRPANARTRLPGDERRSHIIEAARGEFADKGFQGTSIKDIAAAAGISSGLLYAYFESKEALFEECLETPTDFLEAIQAEVEALGPGCAALVLLIYGMFSLIVLDYPKRDPDRRIIEKLLVRSCLGDGGYKRQTNKRLDTYLASEFIFACYKAAEEKGEILELPIHPFDRMHFMHELAGALSAVHFSDPPSFDYYTTKRQLMENAVLFCLRGVGLTEDAIATYFQPDKLALSVKRFHSGASIA